MRAVEAVVKFEQIKSVCDVATLLGDIVGMRLNPSRSVAVSIFQGFLKSISRPKMVSRRVKNLHGGGKYAFTERGENWSDMVGSLTSFLGKSPNKSPVIRVCNFPRP